jgi:hypothetical protein
MVRYKKMEEKDFTVHKVNDDGKNILLVLLIILGISVFIFYKLGYSCEEIFKLF